MKTIHTALVFCLILHFGKPLLQPVVLLASEKHLAPVLREVQGIRFGAAILSLDLAKGSDMAAVALSNGNVRIWHLDTGEIIREFAFGRLLPAAENQDSQNELLRTRFAPDGKTLAISHRSRIHLYEVGTWSELKSLGVEIEDASPTRQKPLSGWLRSGQMTVTDFAFTPDGGDIVAGYCRAGCEAAIDFGTVLIAAPTGKDPIRLWDVRAGKLVWERTTEPAEVVERIVPSPNGKLLATVSQALSGEKRVIRMYDLVTGQHLYALPEFYSNSLAPNLLFTRDSERFITASRTSWKEGEKSQKAYCMRMHLGIFQTQTGKPIFQIVNSYGTADTADISEDNRWLAAPTCRTVGFQLWDMRTVEAVARVQPRMKGWRRLGVELLRFAPDGRTLVVANLRQGLVAAFRSEF